MTRLFRVGLAAAMSLALAVPAAYAQQGGATTGQQGGTTATPAGQPDTAMAIETRRATTTFQGDTGLWFVPLGEVLPRGQFALKIA